MKMHNQLVDENGVHKITGETLTPEMIMERKHNVAMKDPNHLKQWLKESNHGFVVMKSDDLVDGLSWPKGVKTLMAIISEYDQQRRGIDSGRTEPVEDPITKEIIQVPVPKTQVLEPAELDQCIRMLASQLYEFKPDWSLSDPPM
jgi:hypothetical protein